MPSAVDMAATGAYVSAGRQGRPRAVERHGGGIERRQAPAGWRQGYCTSMWLPAALRETMAVGPRAAGVCPPSSACVQDSVPGRAPQARTRGAGAGRVLACLVRSVATSPARTAGPRSPGRRVTSTTCGCRACCSARRCGRRCRMRASPLAGVPRLPGLVAADFRDVPGRNIVALIDDDQPCLAEARGAARRGTGPAAGPCRPRPPADAVAAVAVDYAPLPAVADPLRLARARSRTSRSTRATSPRPGRGGAGRRGRIPHRAPGAALHRAQRGHRRADERTPAGRDGRRASPSTARCSAPTTCTGRWCVLLGLPPGEGARGADRDRRRLRRQGGVPVDDRRPRGAAGR